MRLGDLGAHLRRHLGGEVGERLIEEKHFRLAQDRAPDCNALSPSAGERVRFAIEQGIDSKNASRAAAAFLVFRPGKFLPFRREEIFARLRALD